MSQLDTLNLAQEDLVLMGTASCGPCIAASRWLQAHQIPHRKVNVEGDYKLILWLRQATGQRTVPQFFFRGRWLHGGFPMVQALVVQGVVPRSPSTPSP